MKVILFDIPQQDLNGESEYIHTLQNAGSTPVVACTTRIVQIILPLASAPQKPIAPIKATPTEIPDNRQPGPFAGRP